MGVGERPGEPDWVHRNRLEDARHPPIPQSIGPFPLERDVKADCIALWKSVGGHVYDTSSRKESPIRPAGFPDLVILLPRGLGSVTHEVKRPRGKSSDGQIQYAAWAKESNAPHVVGGVDEVRAWLTTAGILR